MVYRKIACFCALKLLRALKPSFELNGQEINLTASIGISVFPADGDDADTLIKQAEFMLYYQPKVDVQSGRIVGAEALIRWQHSEGLLIGDIDAIEAKLLAFRELGLKIAIDDFGTGYPCLSYLSRFPITTLKIDHAFIHDLESNQSTAEITRAIIGLSRGLELEVVAEGAETAEHIHFLTEQGCATVQGFFYSRPLPAAEFEVMLRRGTIN